MNGQGKGEFVTEVMPRKRYQPHKIRALRRMASQLRYTLSLNDSALKVIGEHVTDPNARRILNAALAENREVLKKVTRERINS